MKKSARKTAGGRGETAREEMWVTKSKRLNPVEGSFAIVMIIVSQYVL